ncbi:MAG: substrate-binding domain-containing protein [Planctomycetes bacterium]|nr:substrate-binding domain-containing protein [Planctomycetota bacterium]MBL7043450.1 substrate-binding domain-containing protein [Pirellulaceae bacterium]
MRQTIRTVSVLFVALLLLATTACQDTGQQSGGPGASGSPSRTTDAVADSGGAGDQSEPQDAAPDKPITILCGSSFRPPMEKLTEMYEEETGGRTELSFGGSEDHLPNVKAKAIGDVYVTHSPFQQYTRDADALLRDVEVGFLAPVLVVQKGNPKGIKTIDDLAKPGLQVLLTNPDFSTCGEMTFALLEKKEIKDAVLENVGNAMFKHHSEIGNKLKLGFGDAGIMWNGVANNFLDAIEVVPAPYEYDDEITVSVMGLSYTEQPEQVQKFLDFVETHGQEVFKKFGYVK